MYEMNGSSKAIIFLRGVRAGSEDGLKWAEGTPGKMPLRPPAARLPGHCGRNKKAGR
jgi:hypothetical protein